MCIYCIYGYTSNIWKKGAGECNQSYPCRSSATIWLSFAYQDHWSNFRMHHIINAAYNMCIRHASWCTTVPLATSRARQRCIYRSNKELFKHNNYIYRSSTTSIILIFEFYRQKLVSRKLLIAKYFTFNHFSLHTCSNLYIRKLSNTYIFIIL